MTRATSSHRLAAGALLGVVVLLAPACGDGGAEAGGGEARRIDVTISDFVFDPSSISVAPGESVTITLANEDDVPHTLMAEEIDVDVQVEAGASGAGTFTMPGEDGTYAFHCHIHPAMTGEFVVGEDTGSSGDDMEDHDMESPDTGEGDDENDDGY